MKPISRTIAVWLATIIIVAGVSMGMLYSYASLERKRMEYLKHVTIEANFIAHELGASLFTGDTAVIESISQNAFILSTAKAMRIMDNSGAVIYDRGHIAHPGDIVLQNKISYQDRVVGQIEIAFAPLDPKTVWASILKMTFAILVPLLLASILLTSFILKIYLSDPLNDLLKGIASISDRGYEADISVRGGPELGIIADSVNRLSEKLHQREVSLKENEKILKESLEKYKVLFSSFPLGITVADASGNIVESNDQAEALLGIAKHAHERRSIDAPLWKIIRPDGSDMPQEEYASVRALRQNRLIKNHEQGFVRPDGSVTWLDVTAAPLPANGHGIVIIYGDITEQKLAKERLKQLNANLEKMVSERTALAEKRARQLQELTVELSMAEDRERRRLAADLHDDLQQHLAYIRVRVEIASAAVPDAFDDPVRRDLAEIEALVRESIQKCRNLCYDLTPPELYREGLLQAVSSVVDDFRERYGLTVRFNAAPDSEPTSTILASMLFRSIRELLNNIAKHSEAKTATIDMRCEDEQIVMNVVDHGKGCDLSEVRSRRRHDGGFGLFNIRDRMTFLGGQVEFTSGRGKGFKASLKVPKNFDVPGKNPDRTLPAETSFPVSAEGPEKPADRKAASGCIRIMIVDDHDLMRAGLLELLQRHSDFEIVGEAANGLEAIQKATLLKPDVILMDVSMPELDGIGASKQICRILPGTRIIGLSMSRDTATRQRMVDAGACAFLSKAGAFEELIAEIRSQVVR